MCLTITVTSCLQMWHHKLGIMKTWLTILTNDSCSIGFDYPTASSCKPAIFKLKQVTDVVLG